MRVRDAWTGGDSIRRAWAFLHRSLFVSPTSRTPSPSGGGCRWSVRPFGSSPAGTPPRSPGSTRPGFAPSIGHLVRALEVDIGDPGQGRRFGAT